MDSERPKTSPDSMTPRNERPVVRKLFEEPEPHILDYFTVLAKYKLSIMLSTLLFGVAFVAFTYAMPYSYTSMATILPPTERNNQNILGFLAQAARSLSIMKSQENASIDLFRNVMESRLFAEEVMKDSAVGAFYSSFGTTEAEHIAALQETIAVIGRKDDVMEITAETKTHWLADDREKAAAQELSAHLTNTFVSTLDRMNKERVNNLGTATKNFVASAYQKEIAEQDSLLASYALFQKANGVADLPLQVSTMVQSIAGLESNERQSEFAYNIIAKEFTPSHPATAELLQKVEAAKLAAAGYRSGAGMAYSVAVNSLPKLTQQTAEFERKIKLGDNVLNFLRLQLEQAKIDEARSDPTLTVIDSAPKPLRKSSPHRFSMLLLGLTIGLVGSIAISMFRESVAYFRLDHERMNMFRSYLSFARTPIPEYPQDITTGRS